MYNPLVSEYKLSFIGHRLVQTFFGGLDLRTEHDDRRSLVTEALKILLYCYPALIGIAFNLLIQFEVLNRYLSAIVSAILSVLIMNSLHLMAIRHNCVQTHPIPMSSKPSNKVLSSVLPLSLLKTKLTLTVNSVVGFLLVFLSVSQINLSVLQHNLNYQLLMAIMVYIMCWFAIINAHFSLTWGPPPETATYSTVQTNDRISSVNRPIHVILILTVITANIELMSFPFVNSFCVLFLSLCPLLWLFGVIPPVDALLEWAVERLNVVAFGGGPSPSKIKSAIHLIVSLIALCIALAVPGLYATTLFGYVLSVDIKADKISDLLRAKSIVIYTIPLIAILAVDLLVGVIMANHDLSYLNLWLIIILSVILVIICIIKYSQSVYIFFGTLRNPIYPRSMSGMAVFHKFKAKWTKLFTFMWILIYFGQFSREYKAIIKNIIH